MISARDTKTIPTDLFNAILVINHNYQNLTDFTVHLSKLLFDYLREKLEIKTMCGVSYFFKSGKAKYTVCSKLRSEHAVEIDDLSLIDFNRNTSDGREIVHFIKDHYYSNPFFCVVLKDKLITDRIYGIIILALELEISNDKYNQVVKLSQSISSIVSELFSYKYRTSIGNIRAKIFRDISFTKGFKEKIMFYKMLDGITKLIPFDHSGTFYLLNQRENKLYVYAEKISEANPNYENDKKRYYGEESFFISSQDFDSLPFTPQIISLDKGNHPWLKEIFKYKSECITNILFKKIAVPLDSESRSTDFSLFGLIILCNHSNCSFSEGDAHMLDFFLGFKKENQIDPEDHYNFPTLIKKIRNNFQNISSVLDLTNLDKSNIINLTQNLTEKVENYLTEIMPTIDISKNKSEKVDKISVFCTTNLKAFGKFSKLSSDIRSYLLSPDFQNEVDSAFYGILNTTRNTILEQDLFSEKWNTLTVVKIPNSIHLNHLCILRKGYFDISYYDRLIIKFMAEHLGLTLFDFSSVQMLYETSQCLTEILNLGSAEKLSSIERYFEQLLDIAIRYTDSNTGDIYTVSVDRHVLELKSQKGGGMLHHILPIYSENIKGVVPYVAKYHDNYKNSPYYVEDIQRHIIECPIVGYISTLEGMNSELAVPMFLGEDFWGVLNVESEKPANYNEQRRQIFLSISRKASEIWQQRQLLYALELTGVFLKESTKKTNLFEETDGYQTCRGQIKQLLDITTKSSSAHSTTVRFLDDKGGKLVLNCQSEEGKKSSSEEIDHSNKPNSIVFTAIREGKIIDIPDIYNIDKNKYPYIEYFKTKKGTKAEYAIPLKYLNRFDGVLNIEGEHAFTENEKFIFRTVAQLIELLLIKNAYIVRQQLFEQTTNFSLGLHSLERKVQSIKYDLENYISDKLNKTQFLASVDSHIKSIIQIIENNPLRAVKSDKENISIAKLAEEIRPFANYNNIQRKLELSFSDENLKNSYIEASLDQLKFIFKDLLDNAYRQSSFVNVNVLFQRKWDGKLQILIEDNGKGLKKEIHHLLFKRPIVNEGGKVSLGCFICGIIVADLGGRAYVLKTDESGSIIGIDIPFMGHNDLCIQETLERIS